MSLMDEMNMPAPKVLKESGDKKNYAKGYTDVKNCQQYGLLLRKNE